MKTTIFPALPGVFPPMSFYSRHNAHLYTTYVRETFNGSVPCVIFSCPAEDYEEFYQDTLRTLNTAMQK